MEFLLGGERFRSRLLIGTAQYPNRQAMLDAIAASGAEIVTVSIRRMSLAGEPDTLVTSSPTAIGFFRTPLGAARARGARHEAG